MTARKIPFADLREGIEPLLPEYLAKLEDMIRRTDFIGGKEVDAFESEFAEWTGAGYAIGAANGTDAIIIALKALGIGPGDRVLVPVNTFIATAEAVTMVGAEVDFLDVEPDYYTLDPAALEAYLGSPRGASVRAVIPVHLYGQMADMEAIARLTRPRGIRIIEDTAQAHGSRLNDRRPGSLGDIATYSFYPGKNLGAFGDAGALTTDDEGLHKTCKMLVNHGRWNAKYEHQIEGFNMRLDALQAAILRIKLHHIDAWTARRKRVAAEYIERLSGAEGIETPKVRPGADPVWHIFPVRVSARDEVLSAMEASGISVGIHYPIPLHLQPAYARMGLGTGAFPVAERLASLQLSLPIWPEMSDSAISDVVDALKRVTATRPTR